MISCDNGVNLFKPSGISQSYQLDQSISALRVVGGDFRFYSKSIEHSVNIQWRPRSDAALRSVWYGSAMCDHVPQKDPKLILVKNRHVFDKL